MVYNLYDKIIYFLLSILFLGVKMSIANQLEIFQRKINLWRKVSPVHVKETISVLEEIVGLPETKYDESASKLYLEAQYPMHAEAHYLLGSFYTILSKSAVDDSFLEKSKHHYQQAIVHGFDDADPYIALYALSARRNDVDSVREYYQELSRYELTDLQNGKLCLARAEVARMLLRGLRREKNDK
jgi:hypothetical protein